MAGGCLSRAYEYKDGKRTDTVLGYRYSVALPEKGLDKVDVRIDGQQQTEAPNGYVEVRFDGWKCLFTGPRVTTMWGQRQPESIS